MAESPRALPLLEYNISQSAQSNSSAAQNASNYRLLTKNFISVLNKVGDRPFAIYCMSGVSRIGKSYTLNFFIQNLKGQTPQHDPNPNPLETFSWRKGTKRETVGINLWSEPFFVKQQGREIAILLMDGQGLFDEHTTLQQNSVIFALCSLFSSVCIFNCMKKIQADTLQNVHFFTEYARAIGQKSNETATATITTTEGATKQEIDFDSESFQKLVIMVRDFDDSDEFGFGYHDKNSAPKNLKGAYENYYHEKLSAENKPDIPYENQAVIKGIRDNYDSIGIILHPDPGSKFRQNPLVNQPDPEFIEKTQEFIQLMLSSDYLVTKKIGDQEIFGREFIPYVEHYGILCEKSKDNFPPAQTVAQSTAMMSNTLARTNAYHVFVQKFTDFLKSNGNLTEAQIDSKYKKFLEGAKSDFNKFKKLGDKHMQEDYRKELFARCQSKYESLRETYCLKRDYTNAKAEFELQKELGLKAIEQLNKEKEIFKKQGEKASADLNRLNSQTKELQNSLQDSKRNYDALEKKQAELNKSQTKSLEEVNALKQKLENAKDDYERKLEESNRSEQNFQEMRQMMEEQGRQNNDAISALNDQIRRQSQLINEQEEKIRNFQPPPRPKPCSIL